MKGKGKKGYLKIDRGGRDEETTGRETVKGCRQDFTGVKRCERITWNDGGQGSESGVHSVMVAESL